MLCGGCSVRGMRCGAVEYTVWWLVVWRLTGVMRGIICSPCWGAWYSLLRGVLCGV